METNGYEACCESRPQQPEQRQSVIKLKSTVVTKHSRSKPCLRVISLQSHPEEELSKPFRRIEVTKVRACCVGKETAWFWPNILLTQYRLSRIHLFDGKFPTVGVHNLTNALGLRLAESGFKLLIVNAFKQLSLSLYACWKERTQELVWILKLNSSSLGASSPGALAAAAVRGGGGGGRGGGGGLEKESL